MYFFCHPHRQAAPAKPAQADDGYDDDFETYSGDEFEADEDEEQAEEKPVSKAPSARATAAPTKASSRQNEDRDVRSSRDTGGSSASSMSKGKFTVCLSTCTLPLFRVRFMSVSLFVPQVIHGANTSSPATPAVEDAKYSSTIKMASLHPKAQRIKQLTSMIDLGQERFTIWDQPPISPYDLYHRRLRGTAAAGECTYIVP